jgi:hypothetical protein
MLAGRKEIEDRYKYARSGGFRGSYCMFSVKTPTKYCIIDDRNFAFGDAFIVVLNTQEFMDRVSAAAKSANLQCQCDFIEYFDVEKYSGETGPFRKPASYSYQQEFRFIVYPGSGEPIRLTLGDLSDITTPIFDLSKINDLIEWSSEAAE